MPGLAGRTFAVNKGVNVGRKRAIARAAVEMCRDGESIIINGGTTTFQMVHYLAARRLQILTNSFPIAEHLLYNSKNTVILPGGAVYREQNIILSPFANDGSRHFSAQRMFMGAQGVGPQGITEADPLVIQAEEKLIGQAEELVVLVDSLEVPAAFEPRALPARPGRDDRHRRRGQRRGAGARRGGGSRARRRSRARRAEGAQGRRRRHRQDHGEARARRRRERRDACTRGRGRTGCCPAPPTPTPTSTVSGPSSSRGSAPSPAATTSPGSPSPATAPPARCSPGARWRCRSSTTSTRDRIRSRAAYDAARPPFAETLSPRLPAGLNLGAQIFWQARAFPEAFAKVTAIVGYPQYWTWRLSGVAASELTSLGCHTDLWAPRAGRFVEPRRRRGLDRALPAGGRRPRRCSGRCAPASRRRRGSTRRRRWSAASTTPTPRCCRGCRRAEPPFTVVSSGTWTIVMTVGGSLEGLDPKRELARQRRRARPSGADGALHGRARVCGPRRRGAGGGDAGRPRGRGGEGRRAAADLRARVSAPTRPARGGWLGDPGGAGARPSGRRPPTSISRSSPAPASTSPGAARGSSSRDRWRGTGSIAARWRR